MRIGKYDFRPGRYPSIAFFLLLPLLLSLGSWQMQRAEEKYQLLQARETRKDSKPIDLNRTLVLTEADRHKPASASGRYLPRPQWLLDNRLYQGQPGYHVFSLFLLAGSGGRKLLVNRGWVSWEQNRDFLPEVAVPGGSHRLQGRLDSPASVGIILEEQPLSDLPAVSVVQHLDIGELSALLDEPLPAYALVLDEHQAGVLQRDWQPSRLITPEKHIGYAVQWFALAFALTLIYVGVNTRRREEEQ